MFAEIDAEEREHLERADPRIIAIRDRARRDFRFFCVKFLKIKPKADISQGRNAGSPLVPFVWNEAQEIVWLEMQAMIAAGLPIALVILKARQFGISTLFVAWLFWQMWRQRYYSALVAAYKKTTLAELNETFNTFYESFPPGFRPKLRQERRGGRVSKDEVYLDDRKSSATFAVADDSSVRGVARDGALATEVSHYTEPEEFFGGFLPAMRSGPSRTLIMESTAADGYFRRAYESAKVGKGGRRAVFLPWWIVPKLYSKPLTRARGVLRDALTNDRVRFTPEERREQSQLSRMARAIGRPAITDEQMYWRQFTIYEDYEGDEEFFNQEFPRDDVSCFERATHSAFKIALPLIRQSSEEVFDCYPDAACGTLRSSTYTEVGLEQVVDFVEEPKPGYIDQDRRAGLFLIAPPQRGMVYTIGADVADEAEANEEEDDTSAYSVGCVYCCDTREQVAEWRGKIDPYDFGDILVMLGYFYNGAMIAAERNNMGITTEDRITRGLNYPNVFRWPDFNTGGGKLTKKVGWETNARTKQMMMSELRRWCRDGLFVVRSPGLADEMARYVIHRGKYEPGSGAFADRIIAAALSIQAAMQAGHVGLVLSSVAEQPTRSAAGQAARVIRAGSKGERFTVAPRELPSEFGDLAPLRIDGSLWDAARL